MYNLTDLYVRICIFTAHHSTKDIEFTVTTLNKTQNSTKKSNTKVSKKHGKHT